MATAHQLYPGFPSPRVDAEKSVAKVITIYPDVAKRILTDHNWTSQRDKRKNYAFFYASEMEAGEWLGGGQLRFVYVQEDREYHLIQGQHRLAAVCESQEPVEFTVTITTVYTHDGVGKYYAVEDRGLGRSVKDVHINRGTAAEYGWNSTQLATAVSSTKYMVNGFKGARKLDFSPSDEQQLVEKHADAIDAWFEIINDYKSDDDIRARCMNVGVSSVAIATIHYASIEFGDKVLDFWKMFCSRGGDDLPKKAANKVVAQAIQGRGMTKNAKVSTEHQARVVAAYFNAWVKGKTRVYVKKDNEQLNLVGTSW